MAYAREVVNPHPSPSPPLISPPLPLHQIIITIYAPSQLTKAGNKRIEEVKQTLRGKDQDLK